MTLLDITALNPEAPEVELQSEGLPQIIIESPEERVLQEVADIHGVLLRFVGESEENHTALTDREKKEQLATRFWAGGVIGLLLLNLPITNPLVLLTVAMTTLILVLISIGIGGLSLHQEWRDRRVETLQLLQGAAERERQLIQTLCEFSRPALLHAAASARAADQRVTSRLAFILGPNRAGGLLGALFLVFGIFSAGKYLQDNQVEVPWFGTPVTADTIIVVGAFLLLSSFAVLFAGASVASVTTTADLLERVAALKKNIKDEKGT